MATRLDYGPAAPANVPRDTRRSRSLAVFQIDTRAGCGRSLSSLVESEIIPRLIVAHPVAAAAPKPDRAITQAEVESFAPLALRVEADTLLDHAETLLARGVSVESLLVDLLAPAARELGEYWKADRCDFVDVTMGLWRLQEVVHEIAARGAPGYGRSSRRALFAAMPGDQHGFGALVVEEMFARSGWATDRIGDGTLSDIYDRIGNDWFDLIGLTVSCDCHTGALPAAITALRSVSRNPRLVVMVGGRVFAENPALARTVGADGTAADARAAVAVADELVGAIVREGAPIG